MQPGWMIRLKNLFFLEIFFAISAYRASIAQNVRPFADSLMLSRKTADASTKREPLFPSRFIGTWIGFKNLQLV
jgi:hypothetical protein